MTPEQASNGLFRWNRDDDEEDRKSTKITTISEYYTKLQITAKMYQTETEKLQHLF
jgi:hypothetical protein